MFFGVIIVGVVIALLVGAFAFLNAGPNTKEDLATLSARLTNLQVLTDASQKNIVSSRLRATNTTLALALTNANRDIVNSSTANATDPEKPDPKITAKENTDELAKRLEDARLNAVFDRTYAREISYQLSTTLILIEQLVSRTEDGPQKEFLSTTHSNLKPLQERFDDFNTVN